MEYKFIISALEVAPTKENLNNVVTTVHWRYQLTKEENIVDTYGAHTFESLSNDGFINYEYLTEETVVSWLQNELDVTALELGLIKQVEEKESPSIVVNHNPFKKPIVNTI
jgi:hypothetical protein